MIQSFVEIHNHDNSGFNRITEEGDVADPSDPPPGCAFHPRCRYATEQCRQVVPALEELAPGHWVRCLRARELALQPVSAAGV